MLPLLPPVRFMTDQIRRRLVPQAGATGPDPIDHPFLRNRTRRELADMPWPRPLAGP